MPALTDAVAASTSTVLFLSSSSSSALGTASQLTLTAPSAGQDVYNDTDQMTGWFELRSGGMSPAGRASSTPPAPSGAGYLWDRPLDGLSVNAGTWTPTITLKGNGRLSVLPVVRTFRRSAAGIYTPITSSTGSIITLGQAPVTLHLPSVSAAAVAFGAGDHLYIDLQAQVVKASCCRGDGVVHLDGVGAGAQLVLPAMTASGSGTPTTIASSISAAPPITTALPTAIAPPTTITPTTTTAPPTITTPPTTTAPPTATAPPTTTAPPAPTAPGSAVWHPQPGTSWQWQITGTVDPTLAAQMYDVDLFDAQAASSYSVPGFGTVVVPQGQNAGIINRLHAAGKVVVCYLDTGAWESYRPDQALFPASVVGGQTYSSTGSAWGGEHWLDIRQSSWSAFEPLIAARLDLASRSGCDGVEPDQNNPIGNNPGFPITLADQKSWYLEIARMGHARNLSVGQKNGIETTDADTVAAFDWNLNEECRLYSECAVLNAFIAAGKAVFQVEYTEDGMTTAGFCPSDNTDRFSGLLKHLDLGVWRQSCQ